MIITMKMIIRMLTSGMIIMQIVIILIKDCLFILSNNPHVLKGKAIKEKEKIPFRQLSLKSAAAGLLSAL